MSTEDPKIETSAELIPDTNNMLLEVAKTIGFLLVAIIIFRFYILQPFLVRGISMEPNYHDGQYLVVNEISYHFAPPKRGDAVIFKHPEPACNDFINANYINRVFFQGPCTNYIKRIIGLPGETVKIADGKVFIINKDFPEGFELKESYVVPGLKTLTQSGNAELLRIEKDEYFVLGDNREPNASSDSRAWGILPKKHITGKAFLVLYPLNEIAVIKRATY